MLNNENSKQSEWILDTGASDHICNNKCLMSNYTEFEKPSLIKIGDGPFIEAKECGNVPMQGFDGKQWCSVEINKALFVPDMAYNLFSAGQALDKNLKMESDNNICMFKREAEVYAIGVRDGKLFKMLFRNIEHLDANISQNSKLESLKIWHERFGHQNILQVKKMLSKFNIKYKDVKNFQCEACIKTT